MRPGFTAPADGPRSARHPRALRPAQGERHGEQGIALIVALLSITLMTALGMALMLTSQTETLISANYRDSMEGEYVADAGLERVMDDVLTIPDWNQVLTSSDGVTAGITSGFHDNAPSSPITLPDGRTLNLANATNMINCSKITTCSDTDMNTSTIDRPWGKNNPRFRLYAWGPMNDLIPTGTVNSNYYIAVWIADDSTENDDNPSKDGDAPVNGATSNLGAGVLTLRAESFGPAGAHHVIEATIAKTDTTEIERGYTGQRGQDEQNRRARKAAIQTPGAGLIRSEMAVGGTLSQQSF
jgi:Tfp pilus assembly protein PilX